LTNIIQSDAKESTRPVSLDVNTPEEIDANIDPTITYGKVLRKSFLKYQDYLSNFSHKKGSSVVRMLSYVMGQSISNKGLTVIYIDKLVIFLVELFRKLFLKEYFKRFSYQNVDQFDLWRVLDEVMKTNIKQMFKNYLTWVFT
jgi:aminopeptidase N